MFGVIKKMSTALLSSTVNGSNHTKRMFVSNQKYMVEPTLINLHPNEYSQELDRSVGSCNTLNDLSNKVCVPNKTKDFNLCVLEHINKAYIMEM